MIELPICSQCRKPCISGYGWNERIDVNTLAPIEQGPIICADCDRANRASLAARETGEEHGK